MNEPLPPTSHDFDQRRVRALIKHKLLGAPDEPSLVAGRYRIVARIGRGANGSVYRAYDEQLDRHVAIKLVSVQAGREDSRLGERILREAQTQAQVSHPNVVPVYETGSHEGAPFIAMDLIEGQDLERWQSQDRSVEQILEVYRQAGAGLAFAHERKVVHRDFKPSNVMIGQGAKPRVCVADFGIARVLTDESRQTLSDEPEDYAGSDKAQSPTWTVGLTPLYAPPEQMEGKVTDGRGDQFAFCVSLLEALLKKPPYSAPTVKTLLVAKKQEHIVPLGGHDIPHYVEVALRKGLSADPDRRFASMEALLEALTPEPRKRPPWIIIVAGLAAVVGVTALVAWPEAPSPCGRAEAQAKRIWDEPRRDRIEKAFTDTGLPHATEAWTRVEQSFGSQLGQWQEHAEQACEATQGLKADDPARASAIARSQCLTEQLDLMSRVAGRLEVAGKEQVNRISATLDDLPRPEACIGRKPIELPESARARWVEQMVAADAARAMGEWPSMLTEADRARAIAEEHGALEQQLLAEVEMGKAMLASRRDDEGIERLTKAALRAEDEHLDQIAWNGWLAMIQLGRRGRRPKTEVAQWFGKAESAAQRLDDSDYRLMRLRYERVDAGITTGDQARTSLEEVWRWADEARADHPRVASLARVSAMKLATLLMASSDRKAAKQWADRGMEEVEKQLGSAHPDSITARMNLGFGLMKVCDRELAAEQFRRANAAASQVWSGANETRAGILLGLAQLALQQGQLDRAAAALDEAASVAPDPWSDSIIGLGRANLSYARGHLDEALAQFESAATAFEKLDDAASAAVTRAGAAECLLHLGQQNEAIRFAEQAESDIAAVLGTDGAAYQSLALKVRGLATATIDPDAAERDLTRAREAVDTCEDAEIADIEFGLSVVRREQGKLEESRASMQRADERYETLGEFGARRRGLVGSLFENNSKEG